MSADTNTDNYERHRHPDLQRMIPPRRGAGNRLINSAAPELASRRGYQMGVHDAYKVLHRKYPEAAALLLKRFGMNKDGSITL